MGEAARLFITLPAEVWAIALKPSYLSRGEADAAEEETTCRGVTARELPRLVAIKQNPNNELSIHYPSRCSFHNSH